MRLQRYHNPQEVKTSLMRIQRDSIPSSGETGPSFVDEVASHSARIVGFYLNFLGSDEDEFVCVNPNAHAV